jgi:hypothetical protein
VHPWDGCEVEQVPMKMEATAVSLFIGIFLWVYALSGLFVYALFVTTVLLTKKLRENPYFVLSLTLSACDIQFLIITVFVWDERHFKTVFLNNLCLSFFELTDFPTPIIVLHSCPMMVLRRIIGNIFIFALLSISFNKKHIFSGGDIFMRIMGGIIQWGWFPTFPLLINLAINRYISLCHGQGRLAQF